MRDRITQIYKTSILIVHTVMIKLNTRGDFVGRAFMARAAWPTIGKRLSERHDNRCARAGRYFLPPLVWSFRALNNQFLALQGIPYVF